MNLPHYFLSKKHVYKNFRQIVICTLLSSVLLNCQEKKKSETSIKKKTGTSQWHFPAKDSSMYVTADQQKELYATCTSSYQSGIILYKFSK